MKKAKFNQLTLIKSLFSRDIGKINEEMALKFLQQQGLTLIATNFNCRFGELDLIMNDADMLVFVEVKYRSSKRFGGAIAAVTGSKQKKLIKTALWYMQQNKLSHYPARFDVVAIDKPHDGSPVTDDDITWIKNAFYGQ